MAIDFNAPSQVRTYANLGAFPATGAVKTIYIAEDKNYIYRWNGTAYIEISVADLVGYVPYTGATQDVNLGAYDAYVNKLWLYDAVNDNYGSVHFTDTDFHIEDADGHKMLVIEDGFMQIHKTDTIQSNLYTSGLTATRDHYLPDASGTIALTSNLAGYVPTSRTLTINGTTQDLSADRTFTISTGITIGTTAITSGTVGRVLFEGTGNVVQESANLFWDNTNGRLGIGTSSPNRPLHVVGQSTFNNLIFNDTSATTVHTNIELKSDNAYETGLLLRSTTGLRWQIYVNNYTSNNFIFYNYKLGAQAMMIAGGTNNLLINTTTDAGFKLDVNGTARVGNLTTGSINASSNLIGRTDYGQGLILQGGSGEFRFSNGSGGGWFFTWVQNGSEKMRLTTNNNLLLGTTTDVASSKLTIESTTQGVLFPRMTTTQKNAIASPATGLMVYDTTLNLMALYNGTTWTTL
jgi:hypothetical protein